MPPFESIPPNAAAEAMLAAAERMKRQAPTIPEASVALPKSADDESPFGQPFKAPIELKPGEKSSPGEMPEELKTLGEEDIEAVFGDIKSGEMTKEAVTRTEKEVLAERITAKQNTEYAKAKADTERLMKIEADEDAAVLKLYRDRLGLEVNKPIAKGQKFAFTPYEQKKFREMQEQAKAKQEQPPSQHAA